MEESGTQSAPAVAMEEGQALVAKAGDEAKSLADAAQNQGRVLVHDMRSNLRQQADEQTGRVVQSLHDVGDDLTNMADGTGSPTGPVVDVTHEIADRFNALADRLDSRGIDGSLDDIRSYARRRPARFVLGAFAVGFVAGRILRNADIGSEDAGSGSPDADRRAAAPSSPRADSTLPTRTAAPVEAPMQPIGSTAGRGTSS